MKSNKNIIALLAIMATLSAIAADYQSSEDMEETMTTKDSMGDEEEMEEVDRTEDSIEE
jgi:hypothetical protein